MIKGYIYRHTNNSNGKVYIGQTIQDPIKRWDKGKGYKNQRSFYRAILREGWDNFTHEVIEEIERPNKKLLSQALDTLEAKYIKLHSSMSPSKGYNTSYMGPTIKTILTAPAKRFISKFMKEGKTFEEAYEIYKNYKNGR